MKIIINEFNVNEIDSDTLSESLMLCALKAKKLCKNSDAIINRLALTEYIPYVSTEEQCNAIIDEIQIKKELLDLREILKCWYKKLTDEQKMICKTYFLRVTGRLAKEKEKRGFDPSPIVVLRSYRRDRYVLYMIRSFMNAFNAKSNFAISELLTNPFVLSEYSIVLTRNKGRLNHAKKTAVTKAKKTAVTKAKKRQGGRNHDNSTNERCHCCRI